VPEAHVGLACPGRVSAFRHPLSFVFGIDPVDIGPGTKGASHIHQERNLHVA